MELLLAAWGVAMVLGGATVAGVRFSTSRHKKQWVRSLSAHAEWTTQLEEDGWISLSRYERGREAVIRVLPTRGGMTARLGVHIYDLGLDDDVSVDLSNGTPTFSDPASEDTAILLGASDVVLTATRTLFARHWVVDRVEITEDMLVIEATDRSVPEARRVSRLEEAFRVAGRLAGAIIDVLELKGPGQRCPLCEGAELVPNVGHLMEGVCRNCHGRLLSPAAVQQLFGEELGMGPGELKAGLSDARGLTCPGCKSKMGPLLIEEKILDLCPGCGSMWLDKGELSALSRGRYEEILGPIGEAS